VEAFLYFRFRKNHIDESSYRFVAGAEPAACLLWTDNLDRLPTDDWLGAVVDCPLVGASLQVH